MPRRAGNRWRAVAGRAFVADAKSVRALAVVTRFNRTFPDDASALAHSRGRAFP